LFRSRRPRRLSSLAARVLAPELGMAPAFDPAADVRGPGHRRLRPVHHLPAVHPGPQAATARRAARDGRRCRPARKRRGSRAGRRRHHRCIPAFQPQTRTGRDRDHLPGDRTAGTGLLARVLLLLHQGRVPDAGAGPEGAGEGGGDPRDAGARIRLDPASTGRTLSLRRTIDGEARTVSRKAPARKSTRKPPEPSGSHADIAAWLKQAMPDLQPIVAHLDRTIRKEIPGLQYAVKWKKAYYGLPDRG